MGRSDKKDKKDKKSTSRVKKDMKAKKDRKTAKKDSSSSQSSDSSENDADVQLTHTIAASFGLTLGSPTRVSNAEYWGMCMTDDSVNGRYRIRVSLYPET